MPQLEVNNKIALVTGANRGIGRAFVEALVARGAATVYAAVRDENIIAEMSAINPDVVKPVLLDITRPEHIQAISQQIPSLDLLINNAGIVNACFNSADNAVEIAQQEMQTNYFGPVQLTLALLPKLKKNHGAIVNISSIAGISNFPSLGPYSATKAALHSFTQGLRTELAGHDVLVTGVYPGPTDTRMTEGFEMEKAPTRQIAEQTLDGIARGNTDIFPDSFSEAMYATFLGKPSALEQAFADMHS